MVKQEPVSVNWQTLFILIPILDLWAVYRIQKLRKTLLLIIVMVAIILPIDIVLFPNDFWDDGSSNMLDYSFGDFDERDVFDLGEELITIGVLIVFIRKWSKEWNKKIETGFFEKASETVTETLKLVTEIPRIYVESRWKKPNIYFTIPSIYLFISTGILLIETIVKINDDYFLLSITVSLHLIILSIPSVIGAIQLWRRKKIGLIFSNISLILLSLVMPTSIFGIIQYLPISDLDFISGENGIIFGLSIGLSILMMLFLSKAKKQVVWNEQFSENKINNESK